MIRSTPARIEECMRLGWWSGRTVDDLMQEAVRLAGDQEALADPLNRPALIGSPSRRLTYTELDAEVNALAAGFLGLGLRKQDVVAVQLPNIVEAVVIFLACARLGLIFCPVSMQFRSHELRYLLTKSCARIAITVIGLKDSRPAEAIDALRGEVGTLERVITLDGVGGFLVAGQLLRGEPALLSGHLATLQVDPNDLLTLCWTSGTEARPKGVPRSHNHWIANGEVCAEIGQVRPGDAILNPFPMINTASIGGMVMPWLMNRARLVQHHPFDLPIFLTQLQEERIAYTVAPPAVLSQLLKNEALLANTDLSSLRSLGSGSAPLAPWMVEGWQTRLGISVVNIFGSNEGCALFSCAQDLPDPHDRAQYFPRFGVPGLEWSSPFSAKVRTRLVDPVTEEEVTEPGQPGELRIDGAMRFDGYWDEPELNVAAFDAAGYFRSGDLFEIAGYGAQRRFYRFIGRAKDIIIRGGMKISPAELDTLIEGHPQIREAAFCGVPDDVLGERVGLAAVAKPGETVTLDSVVSYLRKLDVATIKLPEYLQIFDELPRNSLGKVVRRDLPSRFKQREEST
ncbi:class I adenylate-forming enzyme family protein [Povalibacter sp.]|uniref:class I adenylate-forming enzyme family protein n=1 Tax=Povalibacter sp. TaxID=1962978 RepID=UPI002F410A5A